MAKQYGRCALLKRIFILTIYVNHVLGFVSKNNTCGTLLSYRHYIVQLEAAPKCFIDGCSNQEKPTSMSSSCSGNQPCSQLWNTIHDQYQQNWCAGCNSDVACRTKGWPTLNASALCDSTPNTWIFGSDGTCCTSGNQPFELAEWLGSMCNDSEWREPFVNFGGSAKLDWEEWILAWNWTVRVENTTTSTFPQRKCPRTHLSLLAFGGENILVLLFVVGITIAKLHYIHARTEGVRIVVAFHNLCHPLVYLKFWNWPKWGYRRYKGLPLTSPEDQDHNVAFAILVSIAMMGFQVGFNFLNAWRIHSTPGYQNTPIVQLALLFCCRPRLTWLACGLELIRRKTWYKWLNITNEVTKRKTYYALVTISFGAAISEVVLQGISLYTLALTANTGRLRNFYIAGNLTPYWRGPAAMAMYAGAVIWLIGCLLIILAWMYLYYLSAIVASAARRAVVKLKRVKDRVASSKPMRMIFPRKNRRIRPPPPITEPLPPTNYERLPGDPEIVRPGHVNPHAGERIPQPLGSNPGGGNIERIGPVAAQDSDMRIERVPLRDQTRLGPGGHSYERVGVTDTGGIDSSPLSYGGTSRSRDSRSDTLIGSTHYDEGNNLLAFSEVPIEKTEELYADDTSFHEQDRHDPEPHEPDQEELRNTKLKRRIVQVAISIGLFSYAAQWVFWAGFVYAAGPRYCPPGLFSTAGIWLAASISGLGLPFLVR